MPHRATGNAMSVRQPARSRAIRIGRSPASNETRVVGGCSDLSGVMETPISRTNSVGRTFWMRCGRNSYRAEAASTASRFAPADRQLHPVVRRHASSPVSAFGYKRAQLYRCSYGETTLAWSRMVSTMFERGAVASMLIAFVGRPSCVACCKRAKASPSLAVPPHASGGRAASRWFSVSRSIASTNTPSHTAMKRSAFREPPQKNVAAWV